MHARVSTYQTDDPEGLIEGFKSVSSDLEQVDGFSHGYFLVDKDGGKALSITIWESETPFLQARARRMSFGSGEPRLATHRSTRSIITRSVTGWARRPP